MLTNISPTYGSLDEARAYTAINKKDKALDLLKKLWAKSEQYINWYCSLSGIRFSSAQNDCLKQFYILQQVNMLGGHVDPKWAEQNLNRLDALMNRYAAKGGGFPNN